MNDIYYGTLAMKTKNGLKKVIRGVNMTAKENDKLITKILTRASKEGLFKMSRSDHRLDLLVATVNVGLDLQRLLGADDLTFAHDFLGIYRHLDRDKLEFMDCWLPRCMRYK